MWQLELIIFLWYTTQPTFTDTSNLDFVANIFIFSILNGVLRLILAVKCKSLHAIPRQNVTDAHDESNHSNPNQHTEYYFLKSFEKKWPLITLSMRPTKMGKTERAQSLGDRVRPSKTAIKVGIQDTPFIWCSTIRNILTIVSLFYKRCLCY